MKDTRCIVLMTIAKGIRPSMRLKRKLPAVAESLRDIRLLAMAYAGEVCEPDDQLLADVALCVSEAATNVIQHANHASAREVELEVYETRSRLVVQIADTGPRSSEPIEPGIGLRILSQLASTQISHSQTGTTVTMSFPCPPGDHGDL
jgi:anti-sigma regulatory factor (Ser/Thr protein kinase)